MPGKNAGFGNADGVLTSCVDYLLWRLRLRLPEDIDSSPFGYQQILLSHWVVFLWKSVSSCPLLGAGTVSAGRLFKRFLNESMGSILLGIMQLNRQSHANMKTFASIDSRSWSRRPCFLKQLIRRGDVWVSKSNRHWWLWLTLKLQLFSV